MLEDRYEEARRTGGGKEESITELRQHSNKTTREGIDNQGRGGGRKREREGHAHTHTEAKKKLDPHSLLSVQFARNYKELHECTSHPAAKTQVG